MHKPLGCTSFDVVHRVRRTLHWKAVGHAGTLDPSATGVLIILCGDATSRAGEFMLLPKEYVARVRFGLRTSTDDFEGEVVETQAVGEWSAERIEAALSDFRGEIEQIPPAVSAVKVGGRRSYKLARGGVVADLAPKRVTVYELRLLGHSPPEVTLLVRCSRGTYIRSLARDIGQSLGWCGTLASLARTAVGPYRSDRTLSLRDITLRYSEFSGN